MNLLHDLKRKPKGKHGFTLVELIVVLTILAILAALLIPALTGYIDKAKKDQVIAETRSILSAVQTDMSELYATNDFTKLSSLTAIASKNASQVSNVFSSDVLKENYSEIAALSEVPSLQDGGKGQFVCFVTATGKVHSIIYDSGRGYTGCYFAETKEITAYKPVGTNYYFPAYSNCVIKLDPKNDAFPEHEILWTSNYMLMYSGCTGSYDS